jgi:hypothetical protein
MKSIFTLSAAFILTAVIFTSCVKGNIYTGGDSESYWLSQERGQVVYSSNTCNYYVVETANGYTIMRTYGTYRPSEGSIIYGRLSVTGTRDYYNRTYGTVYTGSVTDYWLNYYDAQDALDYYCPLGKSEVRVFQNAGTEKTK